MGRFLTGAALLALLLPGPGEAGAVRLERTPWAERFPDDIDWVLAVDDSLGAQWTRRWVPRGETLADARQMLVEMHFEITDSPEPRAFLDGLFTASRELCTDARWNHARQAELEAYGIATGHFMCARARDGDFGALTHYIVLVSGPEVFVVARQIRHPPTQTAGQYRFDDDAAMAAFSGTRAAAEAYINEDVYLCGEGIEDGRCTASTGPATLPDGRVVTALFDQKLAYSVPPGWQRVFQRADANDFMREYLPPGESLEAWSRMLRVQALKTGAGSSTPADVLELMDGMLGRLCPENRIHVPVATGDLQGFETIETLHGCARFPADQPSGARKGQGELSWILAIQGRDAVYLLHKAWRGRGFTLDEPPVTPENLGEFVAEVLPVTLCQPGGSAAECEPDNWLIEVGP